MESVGAPMTKTWNALLWVAAIATVAPLFASEYLPFTDLPEHLAVMSSLRHYWDPAYRVQEHYALALGQSQYLLYHFTGAALSWVTGSVELSNRLLLAAIGIAWPFSFRALLRALGRDDRLALFACPLFWSRPLVIGFLPFVAAIPVMLVTLAAFARATQHPARGRWRLGLLAVVLFYVHASVFVMLVLSAGAMAVADRIARDRWRWAAVAGTVRDLAWLVPAGAVAALWAALGRLGLEAEAASETKLVSRMPLGRAVRAFALWAHDVWWSHVDEVCAVAFWLAFIWLLLLGMREARSRAAERDMTFVPFLAAGALYLLLPFQIGAGYMLNVRMAPVLALFAVLAVVPARASRTAAIPFAAMFVVAMVTAGNAAREIRAAAREELGNAGALVDKVPPGARLLSLSFRATSAYTHFPPWLYFGTYHRVRKGGLAAYSFSEMKHWPLHYVPENAPPPKPRLWVFRPCSFRNATDGAYYDYVLARGDVDPFRDAPPGPVFERVGTEKDFSLYAKARGRTWPEWGAEDRGPCASKAVAPYEDVAADEP